MIPLALPTQPLPSSEELAPFTLRHDRTIALTQYRAQGFGHILKLGGIVTAGTLLVSAGGSLLFAAPLALATLYGMFRSTGKIRGADWCESRDEIFTYRLSAKHRSLLDDYSTWCRDWGTKTINNLIEPMIGNCTIANFVKNKKHPYYGLRGILIYDHDDDDIPPLTPHDYVSYRLKERLEILNRREQDSPAIDVEAQTIPLDHLAPGEVVHNLEATYKFLLSLTSAPLQPVIIAGLPGSGKGILAAMALSLGVKENGLKFWVFNPKAKLDEAGYWNRAEKHFLKDRLQNDPDLFTDLMEVLENFAAEGTSRNNKPGEYRPFILLLEEVNALTGLLTPKQKQVFKSKVIALASLLRGCNMALWLSGQSITLEDLGLTGKSNRAMFTAIAAISCDREAVGTLCQPLSIPFDNAKLKPDERYWLTATGHYIALPAPAHVPQFETWKQVPNLVDLRPNADNQPSQPDEAHPIDSLLADVEQQEQATSTQESLSKVEDNSRSVVEQLEDSYKLNAADEFVTQTSEILMNLQEPYREVATYILERGEVPIGAIKNWAKTRRKGSLDAAQVDEILIDLMALQLIKTFTPRETRAEWVRWIATQ